MTIEATYHFTHNSYGLLISEKETKQLLKLLEIELEKYGAKELRKFGIRLTEHIFGYKELPVTVLCVEKEGEFKGVEMYCADRGVLDCLLKKFAKKIGKEIVFKEKIGWCY